MSVGFLPRADPDLPLAQVRAFLDHEAEILDDTSRIREWHELLTDDFVYQVPIRVRRNTQSKEPAFPPGSLLMYETRATIERRARRLETGLAYGEEPPALLRRVIGGVRAHRTGEHEFGVRSSFLLYHNRNTVDGEIVAGERQDTIRFVDGRMFLAARLVHLDHLVVPTQNITFFL